MIALRSSPHSLPAFCRSLVLLVTLFLGTGLVRAEAAPGYEEQMARARSLAAEGSWALAKDAYAAVMALAPDADAHRWVELGLLEATWRAEPELPWSERQAWVNNHGEQFRALGKAYGEGRPKDDFWVAWMGGLARFYERHGGGDDPVGLRAEIADHLGAALPTEASAAAYVGFLRQSLGTSDNLQNQQLQRFLPHLLAGMKVGVDASDRAWCAWFVARVRQVEQVPAPELEKHLRARVERWAKAIELAHGTRWETLVIAEDFLWKANLGWSGQARPGELADIPGTLAQAARLRSDLAQQAEKKLAGPLIQQLTQLEENLGKPRLVVGMGSSFAPGSVVKFTYGTTGFGRLDVTLTRWEPADWARLHTQAGSAGVGQQLKSWAIALPGADQRLWHSEVVDLGDTLKPGFYSVTFRAEQPAAGDSLTQRQDFIVSAMRGVALVAEGGTGELFVYATADGKPVAGAKASGLVAEDVDRRLVLTGWQGTTDPQGRLAIALPKKYWRLFAGTVGDQPVWFPHSNYVRAENPLLVDAFVERPLFRPGETAHWKLVLRERQAGRFVVPDGAKQMRLRVELGDESLVAESPIAFNAFGTAHGEIAIPAGARPGEVTLTLLTPEGHEENLHLFRVDNFVAPAVTARIELVSGTDSLRPGQEMVVRLTASYFSGGPVVDAPAECVFSGGPRTPNGGRSTAKNQLQGRTDANGTAEFRMLLPADAENTFVSCVAGVMPAGTAKVDASASYVVTAAGFTIDPTGWTKPRLVRPGGEVAFSAQVRNGAKVPAPFKGELQLVEKKWSEAWLGPQAQVVDGAAYRRIFQEMAAKQQKQGFAVGLTVRELSGWSRLHAGFTEIEGERIPVEAGPDGRIAARFRLPHEGIYELRVTRSEMRLPIEQVPVRGRDEHTDYFRYETGGFAGARQGWGPSAFVFVAADENTRDLAGSPEAADLAWPENPDPQSRLVVLAMVPEGTPQAWLTVGAENAAITKPLTLRGKLGFCVIDHPPAFHGTGQATLTFVYPGTNHVRSVMDVFAVRDDSKRLQVTVTPDAMAHRPGESAKVNIAVTDRDGRPRRAELAVAIADEAVVSLVDRDADEDTPYYLRDAHHATVRSVGFGGDRYGDLVRIGDPRRGVRLNAYRENHEGEETLVLSPFTVQSADGHYYAASTLAGTRIGIGLHDSSSAISVVTSQFLQDTAANNSEVLVYTTAAEAGGVAGNSSGATPRLVVVRRHFSSSALWAPEVVTDKDGRAEVSFKYPDNLTQWRIATYAAGREADTFGGASVLTRTSLPLQARLNLPRFLVAGDTAEVSATLVNRADQDFDAMAELKVTGAVTPLNPTGLKRTGVAVPRQAEARLTWSMAARQAGAAQFSLAAVSGKEADAMILPLPVLEDGIQQETAATGRMRPEADRLGLTLPLPATLDRARTRATLQLSPSYAATMLDALPYLVDYPYGCVEQTMSRFLPAVIVRQTLTDLGLDAVAVEQRILGSESAADIHRRTTTAGLGKLDEVVALGLGRLQMAQSEDGGFGWWPGAPSRNLWMTAYVAWGLDLAVKAGIAVPEELAEETFGALYAAILTEAQLDDRLAFALSVEACVVEDTQSDPEPEMEKKFSEIYAAREKLSASGRACLALASTAFGTAEQRGVLLRNLENGAQRVKANDRGDTVHWGSTTDYWRAMDGAVETTALTLSALLKLEPGHPLIEPAVNWLVLNRRSSHWASTRDTAFAILALNQYLRQTKELDDDREFEVLANGTVIQRCKLTRESLLAGAVNLEIPVAALQPGDNSVELRRVSGSGPVHAVALASAWAVGDEVKPAASLISVSRGFERNATQPTLLGTLHITPQPLAQGGSIVLGEELAARVILEMPNELEYVMVEVPKPAGCEPLNRLSGWDAQLVRVTDKAKGRNQPPESGQPIYREERDDKSVFFLDRVEAGTWEIRFSLRATTVGDFRALPTVATAMYVPEVRANSDARRVVIRPANAE